MAHQDPRKARATEADRDLMIAKFPQLAKYIRHVYKLLTAGGIAPARPVLAAFVALMDAWNAGPRRESNLGTWGGIRLPFVYIDAKTADRYHTAQTDLLHGTLLPFSRGTQFAAVSDYLAQKFNIMQCQEHCCAVNWLPGDRGRSPKSPGTPPRAPGIHAGAAEWIEARNRFGTLAETTGTHVRFAATTVDLPDTLLESQWEIRLLNSVWGLVCDMADKNPVDWEADRAARTAALAKLLPTTAQTSAVHEIQATT